MKLNLKKTGLVVMDIVLGAYLILAFTAFNKPDEKSKMCTKVNINIQDESTNGFINAKEISDIQAKAEEALEAFKIDTKKALEVYDMKDRTAYSKEIYQILDDAGLSEE